MIGEMRDTETIDIALKAAETGHLVISTAHTTDAAKTVQRLLAVFSPSEQAMMRMRLAESLRAVVSQRLLPRLDGKGVGPRGRGDGRDARHPGVHPGREPRRRSSPSTSRRAATTACRPSTSTCSRCSSGRDLEGRRALGREQPGGPGPADPRRRAERRHGDRAPPTTARCPKTSSRRRPARAERPLLRPFRASARRRASSPRRAPRAGRPACAARSGRRPRPSRPRARRGRARSPPRGPASAAAPSAVTSSTGGRRTGTPSTSAWNCIRKSLRQAPPSTRSASSARPASALKHVHHVAALVGDRLQRGADQVRARRAAREPDQRAARALVPVRRAEAHEGRHQVDAAGVLDRARRRLALGGARDEAEPVAQPLHRRAGDEDAALERVLDLAAEAPRDRS